MLAPRWWPDRGLWRHREFLRLWAAQVVSAMGSRITRTALPVIAVSTLLASPAEVAVLSAMAFIPGLALALFAGGIADRGDKRAILIGADLVRAAAVISIPVAAWTDTLGLAHLIVVAGVVGGASAMFQITDNAYLPALVGKDQLLEGNAKLEATESVAEIVGPAAAGGLIRALGAPLAVLVDALSYLWSAMFLWGLPRGERTPVDRSGPRRHALTDLGAGLRALRSSRDVSRLVLADMFQYLGAGFFVALYMVFTLRELDLGEATVGVVIAFGGVGALLGALLAPRMAARLGLGRTLLIALVINRAAAFLIPVATDGGALSLLALIGHQIIGDGFTMVFAIHAITVRQTALPGDVLGRANAAVHVLTIGSLLLGTVIGGILGELSSARTGLLVGAAVGMLAPLVLFGVSLSAGAPRARQPDG